MLVDLKRNDGTKEKYALDQEPLSLIETFRHNS